MKQDPDEITTTTPTDNDPKDTLTGEKTSSIPAIEPTTINQPAIPEPESKADPYETMPSPNLDQQIPPSSQPPDPLVQPPSKDLSSAEPTADDTMDSAQQTISAQTNISSTTDTKPEVPVADKVQTNDPLPNVLAKKQSGSKYTIVLTVLMVFAIAGISFAGYQFYQNYQQNGTSEETSSEQTRENAVFVPEIVLDNGNIITTLADGNTAVLFDKSEFETAGIMGFSDLVMAPDGSVFCFHTKPPAPVSSIYISDLSGANLQEIGQSRTGCRWLNSNSIAYLNTPNPSTGVDIYMFDLQDQVEINLTDTGEPEGIRYFNIRGIDNDGETILCNFSFELDGELIDCSINTKTRELIVAELPQQTQTTAEVETDPKEADLELEQDPVETTQG